MNSVRYLLCFVLGAAITAGFVALLLPVAPWPYTLADLGMRRLNTVRASVIFLFGFFSLGFPLPVIVCMN
jgi:hypothetical protein